MTTVLIDDSKSGNIILELIKEMGCGEILSNAPNEETQKAIEDARNGVLHRAKSAGDLCKELEL